VGPLISIAPKLATPSLTLLIQRLITRIRWLATEKRDQREDADTRNLDKAFKNFLE
jgi:hypothetical protein